MVRKAKTRRRVRRRIPVASKILASKSTYIVLIAVLVLSGFLLLVKNYLITSEAFKIKEIGLAGMGHSDSYLTGELTSIGLGENIFSININDLEKAIKRDYFEVKDIRISRTFPNKLKFDVEVRIPVAFIGYRYFYPVDREALVLKRIDKNETGDLTLIAGVGAGEKDVGTILQDQALEKALALLEELSKSGVTEDYHIARIDAASSRNISFIIDDGVQIKIGGEDFKQRLSLLKKVLSGPGVNLAEIRYIDLRFKDPVIGPK